jgi:hypothetical protein
MSLQATNTQKAVPR